MPKNNHGHSTVESKAKEIAYSLLKKSLGVNFYSQATQDLFVLEMVGHKKGGFYLEIGAGHPKASNNTFLLETRFEWRGLSIELDVLLVSEFRSVRKNPVENGDALLLDFPRLLTDHGAPKQIDYLSLDIDPSSTSLAALERATNESYRFSVITFEHDRYQSGPEVAALSRELLSDLGYLLVAADVEIFGRAFEDWWVDPSVVPESRWRPFVSSNEEFSSLWIDR